MLQPEVDRYQGQWLHQSASLPTVAAQRSMLFADDMVKAAREQSCKWWAPSAAQDRREGTLRVRRQREDGSGLGNLHDGLAAEESNAGSCTYTRAVGCSLRGSAQILQLKERCVILTSVREVLLDDG